MLVSFGLPSEAHPLTWLMVSRPVHLYWTGLDRTGCANEDARLLIATIINIVTDIQVVLMPIPIIIRLQIPIREKITLGVLMCLGIVFVARSPNPIPPLLELRFPPIPNSTSRRYRPNTCPTSY